MDILKGASREVKAEILVPTLLLQTTGVFASWLVALYSRLCTPNIYKPIIHSYFVLTQTITHCFTQNVAEIVSHIHIYSLMTEHDGLLIQVRNTFTFVVFLLHESREMFVWGIWKPETNCKNSHGSNVQRFLHFSVGKTLNCQLVYSL